MAHILKVIPKGFRAGKKIQTLNCMKNNMKNIQKNIDCAIHVKQQLEADVFEQNKKIMQSTDTAKNL